MRSRIGIQQDTSQQAAKSRRAPLELEFNAKKKRRHKIVPYRYRDLDLTIESDDSSRDANSVKDVYYRGVHVACTCVTPGGWCRADRQAAPHPLPLLIGFKWLNFEDRKILKLSIFKEDDTENDHRLDNMALSPFYSPSRTAHPLAELEDRYFLRTPGGSTAIRDGTWLYEKLDILRRISRKNISDYEARKIHAELQKETQAKGNEDDDDNDIISVRSQHDFIKMRVWCIASVLYEQLQLERAAMLAGEVEFLIRSAAFYMLSCSKTEGSNSVRQICQKQLQLIEHFVERWPDKAVEVQPILSQLHLYRAAYTEDITIEDVAFQTKKTGCPLRALITPPTADIHNIGIERFIESVIYRQLVNSQKGAEPGGDVTQPLRSIRGLFEILIRYGDIAMLATAVCSILSALLDLDDLVAFNILVAERASSQGGASNVKNVTQKYEHINKVFMKLYETRAYPWLTRIVKLVPRLGTDVIEWIKELVIEPLWSSESAELYNQILAYVALTYGAFGAVRVYDWLTLSEFESVASKQSLPSAINIGWRLQCAKIEVGSKLKLISECRICLHLVDDLMDWSDNFEVIKFIYRSISTEMCEEFARAILQSDSTLKDQLVNIIVEINENAFNDFDRGPAIWSALCIATILKIKPESLELIQLSDPIISDLLNSLASVVASVDMKIKWIKWCRMINKNMSFYFRFKRTFDDPRSYNRSLSFFKALIRHLKPVSRFGDILNGSIDARFSAQEITTLANFWCQLLSHDPESFWVDLDFVLIDFAMKSENDFAVRKFSEAIPYFSGQAH